MLLKLYSYGKQELLQKLTTSSISDNKKPTDTQIFFEVQRKEKLEIFIEMHMGLKMLLQNLILS